MSTTATPVPPPLSRQIARSYPHGYAVVDVETSGLSPLKDRVLQIAVVQLSPACSIESTWSTLLDPGVDPGPTHVHGLTRDRLAGSPVYAEIASHVSGMLSGRVLVAHNARFDWDFLAAESSRAGELLAVDHRLCTMALSRRLDLPLPNLTLASVARFWGVRQQRAHDAADDTRVVSEILHHSLVEAYRLRAALPLAACGGVHRPAFPAAAPRPACIWRYPGRCAPGAELRQGMKVVFTGETHAPRENLVRRATEAGLDVMNNVSSRTSLLVCNSPHLRTNKATLADKHGTRVVSEGEFCELLTHMVPGQEKSGAPSARVRRTPRKTTTPADITVLPTPPPRTDTPQSAPSLRPTGLLTGHRVLVLGGSHAERATLRARIGELGGQVAVNLTSSVTHVVALSPAGRDGRWGLIVDLALPLLDPETLAPIEPLPPARRQPRAAESARRIEPVVLPRGGVTDLPDQPGAWSISTTWPDQAESYKIDVVALILDEDDQVGGDADFCFYNQPTHPSGAVDLELDARTEAVATIRPTALPEGRRRVLVAAAIDGDASFGDVGPIELVARTGSGAVVARATLDAATDERTLMLGMVYERNGCWRFRAVGQGYSEGLAHLAVLHGVDLAD